MPPPYEFLPHGMTVSVETRWISGLLANGRSCGRSELLLKAAASVRVRLMAIWSASFIPGPEAAEVVLIAQEQPTDQYLDFLSKEVMRTLQPQLDNATQREASDSPVHQSGCRRTRYTC